MIIAVEEASIDISRMQCIAGINDNPIEYGINRVRPFK
jgi:hypothetical protein